MYYGSAVYIHVVLCACVLFWTNEYAVNVKNLYIPRFGKLQKLQHNSSKVALTKFI